MDKGWEDRAKAILDKHGGGDYEVQRWSTDENVTDPDRQPITVLTAIPLSEIRQKVLTAIFHPCDVKFEVKKTVLKVVPKRK